MVAHANFLPPSIDDYFHIVDPKGKLSPPERIRKMNDVLDNLPRSFPKALCYVMKLSHVTIEQLAEVSQVSDSTISRYRRNGQVESYSVDKTPPVTVTLLASQHPSPMTMLSSPSGSVRAENQPVAGSNL